MNNSINNIPNKDLVERAKELNCLYSIDDALKDTNIPLKDVINKIVNIIPEGWRYNDICVAEIKYGEIHSKSKNFKKSILKQTSKITIDNNILGEINVYYTKPLRYQRIFLPEEQKLLNSIAQKLSFFINYQNLQKRIDTNSKQNDNNKNSLQQLNNWLLSKSLTENEANEILSVKINFNKGETICKQGAFTSYIMLLAEGYVKAGIENNNKRIYNFKITKPFNFIGLSELFGTGYYHFSAISLTPSTIYLIEISQFKKLITSNFEFSKNIYSWYCNNIEHLYYQLSNLANKQSNGKMAEVLLYLSAKVYENKLIPNFISRKDIANIAGISHESTVRILSNFKKGNIINIQQKGIEIKKSDLLKAISIAG